MQTARERAIKKGKQFKPLHYGYHNVSDVLPEEAEELYLCWQLAEGDVKTYFYLIEEKTIVEVTEAIAMMRTQYYISQAPKNKKKP